MTETGPVAPQVAVAAEPSARGASAWTGPGRVLFVGLVCVPVELGLAHGLASGDPIEALMRGQLAGLAALGLLLAVRLFLVLIWPSWLSYRLLTLALLSWRARHSPSR